MSCHLLRIVAGIVFVSFVLVSCDNETKTVFVSQSTVSASQSTVTTTPTKTIGIAAPLARSFGWFPRQAPESSMARQTGYWVFTPSDWMNTKTDFNATVS